MQLKIGLSLLSGAPFAPARIAQWAVEAGFNCCQVTPSHLWGLNPRKTIERTHQLLPIVLFENAWQPVSFGIWVSGHLTKNPEAPGAKDMFLFPRPKSCAKQMKIFCELNPEPQKIVHESWQECSGSGSLILEVNPGILMSPEMIVLEHQRLAVDLYHLRRMLRPDEITRARRLDKRPIDQLGYWQDSLPIFLQSGKVEAIHISPAREYDYPDELHDILAGQWTELDDMMEVVVVHASCDTTFIAEFNLVTVWPDQIRWALEGMAKWLRNKLDA